MPEIRIDHSLPLSPEPPLKEVYYSLTLVYPLQWESVRGLGVGFRVEVRMLGHLGPPPPDSPIAPP